MDKQLQSLRKTVRGNRDKYALVPTKNDKERYLIIAPFVVELLKKEKAKQDANRAYYEDLYKGKPKGNRKTAFENLEESKLQKR